ncbi:MAG: hypothetical protein F7C08_00140, partial [Desulfurococcales archaeon]|nr:hypothetical protein [Desulfurococcales archaeon]
IYDYKFIEIYINSLKNIFPIILKDLLEKHELSDYIIINSSTNIFKSNKNTDNVDVISKFFSIILFIYITLIFVFITSILLYLPPYIKSHSEEDNKIEEANMLSILNNIYSDIFYTDVIIPSKFIYDVLYKSRSSRLSGNEANDIAMQYLQRLKHIRDIDLLKSDYIFNIVVEITIKLSNSFISMLDRLSERQDVDTDIIKDVIRIISSEMYYKDVVYGESGSG